MTSKRITRDDLAETITDALLAVQDHDTSECTPHDVAIMITLLRCSVVFLANDDFEFIDIEAILWTCTNEVSVKHATFWKRC